MTPRENIISKAELMKMLQCNTERLVDIEYLFHELANGDMNHKNIDRIFKEKFSYTPHQVHLILNYYYFEILTFGDVCLAYIKSFGNKVPETLRTVEEDLKTKKLL